MCALCDISETGDAAIFHGHIATSLKSRTTHHQVFLSLLLVVPARCERGFGKCLGRKEQLGSHRSRT
jgi:hypothetical protein